MRMEVQLARLLTGEQGYEVSEGEVNISIDTFRARYSDDGIPKYEHSHRNRGDQC